MKGHAVMTTLQRAAAWAAVAIGVAFLTIASIAGAWP
jgi:hypothetical protein